jgi:predicted DNA binding CopG/RHH family protein
MKKRLREIRDYDDTDTTASIDRTKRHSLGDIGFKLPPSAPTQVVSIRLPTALLNQIRSEASAQDVPYQALIKILLSRSLRKRVA